MVSSGATRACSLDASIPSQKASSATVDTAQEGGAILVHQSFVVAQGVRFLVAADLSLDLRQPSHQTALTLKLATILRGLSSLSVSCGVLKDSMCLHFHQVFEELHRQ